ncbi:T9SS type A sorting domain-containing protein [Rasiella rasia]|uniref:T9SS type A sorting domain-containing protein n=1 Tax=Rasiella rasia TaxID=2744027 RepID=A0A6G6GM54_9FLAO|nr:T9SS type A sorting domain-containing protein [Rasiella rasia]QIE59639.1 T9SS type A sorting domain-containing protein [Rasiella rasia]
MKHLHFIILFALSLSMNAQVTVTTITPAFKGSGGLSLDTDGNLYIGDFGDMLGGADPDGEPNFVMKLDSDLNLTVFSPDFTGASGNAFDNNGVLHQADIRDNAIYKVINGARELVTADGIVAPVGIAFDSSGNLYVCNCGDNTIRKITPAGISTLFSSGTMFACPNGMTIDGDDNLYVVNFSNTNIVKITPDGTPEIIANTPDGNGNGHIDYDPNFNVLYIANYAGNQIFYLPIGSSKVVLLAGSGVRGNDDGAALDATFSTPNGIAVSEDGNVLYVNCAVPLNGAVINPQVIRKIEGLTTLSVSENRLNAGQVTVFPNPAEHEITFQLEGISGHDTLSLEIYDTQGRLVHNQNGIAIHESKISATISLENFATGTYVYTLSSVKESLYSGKFYKNRL